MDTISNKVILYQNGNYIELKVQLDTDTVWLNQAQMVELFESSKANVSEHIKNIFNEGELIPSAVVRKFRTTASDGKSYNVEFYNLDMIISLGYRIKSKTATKFRIWATRVLKEYTVNGVAVNRARLEQLNTFVDIISRSEIDEVAGVGEVIKRYTGALHLLEAYDENNLPEPAGNKESWQLTYAEARAFLNELKQSENFTVNFASERSEHFQGIVAGIYQTFADQELYPTIQDKAANLLYQVVKDHPFFDGNKRSGAALFIYFLAKNNALRDINSNALAAITLMVALSKPQEKDQIVLLIRNFLEART